MLPELRNFGLCLRWKRPKAAVRAKPRPCPRRRGAQQPPTLDRSSWSLHASTALPAATPMTPCHHRQGQREPAFSWGCQISPPVPPTVQPSAVPDPKTTAEGFSTQQLEPGLETQGLPSHHIFHEAARSRGVGDPPPTMSTPKPCRPELGGTEGSVQPSDHLLRGTEPRAGRLSLPQAPVGSSSREQRQGRGPLTAWPSLWRQVLLVLRDSSGSRQCQPLPSAEATPSVALCSLPLTSSECRKLDGFSSEGVQPGGMVILLCTRVVMGRSLVEG